MSKPKRVILLDNAERTVFPSITQAAAYCGGYRTSLLRALKRGSTYRGFSFVLEGSDIKPKRILGCNRTNHPGVAITEFRDGELFCIYPSKHEAARKMGMDRKSLNMILQKKLRNHSGKDFAVTSPLDECLMEIQERNKRPYQ